MRKRTIEAASIQMLERRILFSLTELTDATILKVATQNDSKIVLAGSIGESGSRDFFLARLNVDGTLDTTFGIGGTVRQDFGGDDAAADVAVDSLGRIIAAGTGGSGADFLIARFSSAGALDTTFASGGKQLIDFSGNDAVRTMAIDGNGKILVGGVGSGRTFPEVPALDAPELVRLKTDGTLDTSFGGGDGKATLTFTAFDDFAASSVDDVTFEPDGKIVLSGTLYSPGHTSVHPYAARLLSDGSPDTTFSDGSPDAIGFTPFAHDDMHGVAIAAPGNNTFLAAGFTNQNNATGMYTLTADGQTDQGPSLPDGALVRDILIQAGGKLLILGGLNPGLGSDDAPQPPGLLLARYNAIQGTAATLDSSFGDNGIAAASLASVHDLGFVSASGAVDPQGRIILAGIADSGSVHQEPLIARFDSTGHLDPTFNGTGLLFPNRLITVSGRVFNDKNATGVFDEDDAGINNFRVFLDAFPFNGLLDPGELSTKVSATGTYHLNNVPPGDYRLQQVARAGWRQSAPAPGFFLLHLGEGETAKNLSFANTDTILIKGTVFLDANKNHKRDAGEPGLAGWTIFIDRNTNGAQDAGEESALSDARGNYRLFNLPAGTYIVRITSRNRYTQTAPAAGSYTITLPAAGTTSHKNFGEKRR